MSDFEVFSGLDQGDAMDPGAFERFKEQMKANSAQIKALQKAEHKQKKKEGKLVKILLRFIQTSQKTDLVLLISRCLELNIPAEFLLSVILLGNEDIQKETEVFLALPAGVSEDLERRHAHSYEESRERREIVTQADMTKVIPLKIRIQIDLWGKNMLESATGMPHKILNTILVHEKGIPSWQLPIFPNEEDEAEPKNDKKNNEKIQPMLIRLTAHVLHECIQGHGIDSDVTVIKEFAEFILRGLVEKVKDQVENQKELAEGLKGSESLANS
ncbi:hypothetical protein HZA41_02960 [Candidatus Peregrinibacteria bacterium]|nr:hypothetical protein [Candidatus Peregrinibacteria bacterium]